MNRCLRICAMFIGLIASCKSGVAFSEELTPAQNYCAEWNKGQRFNEFRCKPDGANEAVFTVSTRRPGEIWGRWEFMKLGPVMDRGGPSDDGKVLAVLKTSDGIAGA